jgi:hypothetical protein
MVGFACRPGRAGRLRDHVVDAILDPIDAGGTRITVAAYSATSSTTNAMRRFFNYGFAPVRTAPPRFCQSGKPSLYTYTLLNWMPQSFCASMCESSHAPPEQ